MSGGEPPLDPPESRYESVECEKHIEKMVRDMEREFRHCPCCGNPGVSVQAVDDDVRLECPACDHLDGLAEGDWGTRRDWAEDFDAACEQAEDDYENNKYDSLKEDGI